MFSKTSEYALRAMTWIAQQGPGATVSGPKIAAETGVPRKYLAMILGALVRQDVLQASPGRNGGFTLSKPAADIRLAEVVGPFEPRTRSTCPFGNRECSDEFPCGAHHYWKRVKNSYLDFLEKMTLHEVAKKNRHHRPRAAKRPVRT